MFSERKTNRPICCPAGWLIPEKSAEYMRRSIDNVVKTKIIPVIEANCWEFRGCFRYENFSRIFGPNRTRISAAAQFLFCRFQQLSEIRYFVSDPPIQGFQSSAAAESGSVSRKDFHQQQQNRDLYPGPPAGPSHFRRPRLSHGHT